jgi:hypothetical protein
LESDALKLDAISASAAFGRRRQGLSIDPSAAPGHFGSARRHLPADGLAAYCAIKRMH